MEENKIIRTAKEEWDACSDEYFAENASVEIIRCIIEDPSRSFPAPVWDMIRSSYPNLRCKNVLVPSSGDNAAVFAFHLLGAAVTSYLRVSIYKWRTKEEIEAEIELLNYLSSVVFLLQHRCKTMMVSTYKRLMHRKASDMLFYSPKQKEKRMTIPMRSKTIRLVAW